MLTPDDLQRHIEAHHIAARLLRNLGETPTVPDAARVLGVRADDIVKTLVFALDRPTGREHVVVISFGERRVDKGLIAAAFDVAKKRVSFAEGADVLRLLGFPPGGVPPFGHLNTLPTLLDLDLASRDGGALVYPGGGDDATMMAIQVGELIRVVQPRITKLA